MARYVKLLVSSFLIAFCNTAVGEDEQGLSTASPDISNLSKSLSTPPAQKAKAIEFEVMDNSGGQIALILKQAQHHQNEQDILSARTTNEESQVLLHRDAVTRTGNVLIIKGNENTFKFIDWSRAETKSQEGDGETFRYAGTLASTGYHRIDVNYVHDSPGTFLVNPETSSILYIHTGDDLASISNNAQRLMIMNSGFNPPFGIGVANLQNAERRLELHCQGSNNRKPKIIPSFKGWHVAPYIGFNVVLLVEMTDGSGRYEAIPMQFSRNKNRWHVFVPEPSRFAQIAGISCWQ